MAFGTKISELPVATSLTGLELTVVVQGGETRRSTVEAMEASVSQRVDVVSALASANAAAVVSTNAVVGALELRVSAVSAQASVLGAALTSTNAVVSALDTRVGLVSALTSVNAAAITSVNAVVSTKVFRNGDYMDNVQYIEFDTSTKVDASVGRLSWNLDDGTLNLGLIGGSVVNQLGQELVQRCYNNTGAPITEGSVVKVVGATGQRLTIELAQANNDANSLTVIGVATETIADKALGYVATEGFVRSINTHGFADGDVLWLSPTTPGALTNVKPVAPQHMVMIGYVVKGGSVGAGSIFVKVQNGYELGELHDVKVSASTSLSNNEVLAYNASAGVWTNSTLLIDVQNSVSALTDRVALVSAATSVNAATVSALELRVSAVSTRASVNAAAITSTNNVVSALELRVSSVSTAVSALQQQVAALDVSAVNIRLDTVSAVTSINAAAITSVNNAVSALEIRVSAASAAATSINNVVSVLTERVANVSASVSALVITVAAVSALVSVNTAAITSINAAVSLKVNRAGDTMTDNLTVPSLNSGPLAGFRNAIVNGNFDIWQRGTTFTNPAAFTQLTADRWMPGYDGSGATRVIERLAFTPGQTEVPGEPSYYLSWTQTAETGATYGVLMQRIESVKTYAGQRVTLSFYAKKGTGSVTLPSIVFTQYFGTGGSPSAVVYTTAATNLVMGTSWAKYTVTATVPSISGKTLGSDNNDFLGIEFQLPINNTATFQFLLAQVQLELGPVATPFERRPIGTELALCQRYYQVVNANEQASSAGNSLSTWSGAVAMRAAPTATQLSAGTASSASINQFVVNSSQPAGFFQIVASVAGGYVVNVSYALSAEL